MFLNDNEKAELDHAVRSDLQNMSRAHRQKGLGVLES
jgi:hypothetical protein